MSKIDAQQIYMQFKKGDRAYKEEVHCPMIIDVMNNEGTATAFQRKAFICETSFYNWLKKHKLFRECYAYGKIISRDNWDKEGELGKDEEYFNFELWRIKGAMRYGIGKNRVRFGIDPKASPYIQYQQLVEQANTEEFNASEIKQLMESINVGIRAYESFELQEKVNEIQNDVSQMKVRNAHNISAIEKITKTD
jgi:hypothetical protein